MIKMLSKVGIEGTYLNIIQVIYEKPLPSLYSKTVRVPLKIGNKAGISAFTCLIQHSTGSPSHRN